MLITLTKFKLRPIAVGTLSRLDIDVVINYYDGAFLGKFDNWTIIL